MRAITFIVFVVLAGLAQAGDAMAAKRVALVVGVSAYKHAPKLANPLRDSEAMANLFRTAGFDAVEVRQDLDVAELRRVVRDFGANVRDADVAVVFYAGHGIEVDGQNYLIPADAKLESDFDVEDETLSLDRVLKSLEPARQLRLVILDACRDNPFANQMKRTVASRAIGRGLAKIEPPSSGTLIAFAARAGATASDGDGAHSPFTTALMRHITQPGLDLRLAFGKVRDDVIRATNNRQEPFVYGSLGGDTVSLVPPDPQAEARKPTDDARVAALTAPDGKAAAPAQPAMDAADIARLLQAHLKRVGCDPGSFDGSWNDGSSKSLQQFNQHAGTSFNVKVASLDALDAVRAKTARVCPLVCAKGQKADGEHCVQITCDAGFSLSAEGVCRKTPPPVPAPKTATRREPREAAPPARSGGGGKCFAFNGRQYCE